MNLVELTQYTSNEERTEEQIGFFLCYNTTYPRVINNTIAAADRAAWERTV
jgi:hypothetical protein